MSSSIPCRVLVGLFSRRQVLILISSLASLLSTYFPFWEGGEGVGVSRNSCLQSLLASWQQRPADWGEGALPPSSAALPELLGTGVSSFRPVFILTYCHCSCFTLNVSKSTGCTVLAILHGFDIKSSGFCSFPSALQFLSSLCLMHELLSSKLKVSSVLKLHSYWLRI